jgi:hypothetical protein
MRFKTPLAAHIFRACLCGFQRLQVAFRRTSSAMPQ